MGLSQKGFGLVEGLLVVIAFTLIVGVGVYVVNSNKDDKNTADIKGSEQNEKVKEQSKDPYEGWQAYKDDELGYTLKYPTDWEYKDKKEIGKNYLNEPIYDPVSFSPKNTTSDAHIYVESGDTKYKDAESYWKNEGSGRGGNVVSSKTESINGYSAFYVNTKMQSELYTYAIVSQGKAVNLNAQLFGENDLLEIHKKIANSIKFN